MQRACNGSLHVSLHAHCTHLRHKSTSVQWDTVSRQKFSNVPPKISNGPISNGTFPTANFSNGIFPTGRLQKVTNSNAHRIFLFFFRIFFSPNYVLCNVVARNLRFVHCRCIFVHCQCRFGGSCIRTEKVVQCRCTTPTVVAPKYVSVSTA